MGRLNSTNFSRRDINRFLVVNSLRGKRMVSRVDLARELKLTPAAITLITSELIEERYIREYGSGNSHRGRKPVLLELNNTAGYAIGVDLHQLNCLRAVIVDLNCDLLWRTEREIKDNQPESIVADVVCAIDQLVSQSGLYRDQILGVGISFPGIVDYTTGTVIRSANLNWDNISLSKLIQDASGFPSYLDNEANAAGLGVYLYDHIETQQDFVYVSVGPGIGGSLIIDGKVYRGNQGSAGEFGHIIVDASGPVCRCGARGCLEVLAGENAILQWIQSEVSKGRTFNGGNLAPRRASELYRAAKMGDPLACEAVGHMAFYIGIGIANLINLINPEIVIIGGSPWLIMDDLLNEVRKIAYQNVVSKKARETEIVESSLGLDTAIIGAATLVLEEIFQAPILYNRSKINTVAASH